MKVLVTGGTGFLGSWTAQELLARGDGVRILGRNAESGERLAQEGAEFVQADLRDPEAVLRGIRCARERGIPLVGT